MWKRDRTDGFFSTPIFKKSTDKNNHVKRRKASTGCSITGDSVILAFIQKANKKFQEKVTSTVPSTTKYGLPDTVFIKCINVRFLFNHAVWLWMGEESGNPLRYSCLQNPVGRAAWGAAVHSVAQSRTWLRRLSMHAYTGEGNGTPLQCSCLENPRDRGAWWAAAYGVAQSRTRLKCLSSSSMTVDTIFLFETHSQRARQRRWKKKKREK